MFEIEVAIHGIEIKFTVKLQGFISWVRAIPLVAASVCTNPPLPIHFCFLNADAGASKCALPRVTKSISAFEEEPFGFHIILQKDMTKSS